MEKDLLKPYRPIPFWSWNDELEPQKIIEQIHWMKRMGIGGFFMHARAGLQTEYLSEKWLQCIAVGAEEAEKLGMTAWIYDENGWPSGFVGGKLLENEENHDQLIVARIGRFDENATVSYGLGGDKLVRLSQPTEALQQYLNLYLHAAPSTVDILDPKVVDQFIDLTHERYKKHFTDQFSRKIAGFFTDEPQYHRWGTPYTPMIAAYFEEEYHEDILDGLGFLFVEKEGYRRFRYRYWKGMQRLMLRNYSQKVYEWCTTHGVHFTGHYIEETTLGYQLMCCGGVMPFYEYEHIPGIDWLGRATENAIPAIQVASVAAQLGKKRVLTETFACCGWDVKPTELRRIAGYQYAYGVNVMCHHLIPYSERGSRKYDYPAHYCDLNPWIEDGFRTFNDYFTMLGYLLGEGERHTQVAVLHPIRSAYFGYQRDLEDSGFGVGELDEGLRRVNELLGHQGIDYHYLDETLLAKYGSVQENYICCGKCHYRFLVLPKLYTMDKTTEQLLHRYVQQGGRVLLMDEKPSYLEAEPYDYAYLQSNCTLADILMQMPLRVDNPQTQMCYAYRTMGRWKYLYVINPSQTQSFTQRFDFGQGVRSFKRVHLEDLSTEQIGLEITLKPGEDALLFLSGEEAPKAPLHSVYTLRFEQASVSFENNVLPLDYIQYSYDGERFSKPWPCPALFQKLLKERYEGRLYLRYCFEIEQIPEKILLKTEKNYDIRADINGIPLMEKTALGNSDEMICDISRYIKTGINRYTVEVQWHEDQSVYDVLFGENVTEGLKNCIAYHSELQPIYLLGDFGVYPKTTYRDIEQHYVEADRFYIGKTPQCVSDITLDGFPFFGGTITLQCNICLEQTDVVLHLPGEYLMADVSVNGIRLGRLLFDTQVDISDVARIGENEIRVCFWVSNRNLLGPHHMVGEKTRGVSPWSFEMPGSWENDHSDGYHDGYDLKLFY